MLNLHDESLKRVQHLRSFPGVFQSMANLKREREREIDGFAYSSVSYLYLL